MVIYHLLWQICKCVENKTSSFLIGIPEANAASKIPICMGHTPQSAPPRHAVIIESVGAAVDGQLPDKKDKPVQIICRALKFGDARDDANEIYTAMHGTCCNPLPFAASGQDYTAWIIDAMQDPYWIGLDKKLRHQYSCNYIFRIGIAPT